METDVFGINPLENTIEIEGNCIMGQLNKEQILALKPGDFVKIQLLVVEDQGRGIDEELEFANSLFSESYEVDPASDKDWLLLKHPEDEDLDWQIPLWDGKKGEKDHPGQAANLEDYSHVAENGEMVTLYSGDTFILLSV